MAPSKKPTVLLFDIGGVCVVSPFQAILDYELHLGIPPGYINATIQAHSPSGAWQKLERGEITLDDAFFAQFADELNDRPRFAAHCRRVAARGDDGKQVIEALVKKNGEDGKEEKTPKMPTIDAQKMFWNMMRMSRRPDPYMWPALLTLRRSGKFVLAALSNTIDFPPGIRDETGTEFVNGLVSETGERVGEVRDVFDVFISSAHVGLRKPQREIYEMAVREAEKVAKSKGIAQKVEAGDVVFLDDIGANLKGARKVGMGTIKVNLGKSKDAVRELEKVTGMSLIDEAKASKL